MLALGEAAAFQRELGVEATAARRAALFDAFRDAVDGLDDVVWHAPRSFARGASLFALRLPRHDARAIGAALFEQHGVVVRAFGQQNGWLRISPNIELRPDGVAHTVSALQQVMR